MLKLQIHGHLGHAIKAKDNRGTYWIEAQDEHGNEALLFLEPAHIEQIGAQVDAWREELRIAKVAKEGPPNGFEGATLSGSTLVELMQPEEEDPSDA